MTHQKSGGDIPYGRDFSVIETVGLSATGSGKMRMALIGPAAAGRFKIAGAAFQIGLMHQVVLHQGHQGAIDGSFIRTSASDSLGNLFLCKRAIGLQKSA